MLHAVLLEELAVLGALLGLILALSAGLAILKNAVCASDGWQKLCFRSVHSLSLLRAVRDHEGLARRGLLLDAVRQLGLLLVLQLRQGGRLLGLVEVRVRRILILLLVFGRHRLLDEGRVPLLRYDAQLVVLAAHGGLLALLLAPLEMEQGRVVLQRVLELRVLAVVQRHIVMWIAFLVLLMLIEVWLGRPKALFVIIVMTGGRLLVEDVLAAVGNLIVGIAVLRVSLY